MNRDHKLNKKRRSKSSNSAKVWAGLIIIGIGSLFLANNLNLAYWGIPSWLLSWQMMLVIIGLIIGGNSSFKNPSSYLLIGIGGLFLANDYIKYNVWQLFWPALIIGIGIYLLLDKKKPHTPSENKDYARDPHLGRQHDWDKRMDQEIQSEHAPINEKQDEPSDNSYTAGAQQQYHEADNRDTESRERYSNEDYVKSTAVFSEINKIVISKNFQGGEVVNIFGGTNINLIQSDISEPVVIDVFQIFAGTKIVVPAHWNVHSDIVSVFGEVDDRRFIQGTTHDERKTVYLKGTSIFGGVTIKSM